MKELAAGACVVFLLLIHFIMMIVSIYKHNEYLKNFRLYPVILFVISCFGFINDLVFIITLCWPSRFIYDCINSYIPISAYSYLVLYFFTAIYIGYLAHIETYYKESIELTIYTIYIVAGQIIFYAVFRLIKSIIADSKGTKRLIPKNKPHLD